MRSRICFARTQLLTFAILLALVAVTGAEAQSSQPAGADGDGRMLVRVALGAIVDDPDPIPPLFVDPSDPSRSVVGVSEKQTLIVRIALAINLAACLPAVNGTPCAAAGLDAAFRVLTTRHASAGTLRGVSPRRARLTP
jgi:hypothetical protein